MTTHMSPIPNYGGDLEYDDPSLTVGDGLHDIVRSADFDNLAFALGQWHANRDLESAACLAGYTHQLIKNSWREEL